jgi:hypothetical protein
MAEAVAKAEAVEDRSRRRVLPRWACRSEGWRGQIRNSVDWLGKACCGAPDRLAAGLDRLVRGLLGIPDRVRQAWQDPLLRFVTLALAVALGCFLAGEVLKALATPRPFPPSYTPLIFAPGT